jgi:hypothetical protein
LQHVKFKPVFDLAYNPNGSFVPPAQEVLELEYKRELKNWFNSSLGRLPALTDTLPGRFKESLENSKN